MRVIYAGYIEYPDWQVSRRRGHHEPIITLEVYEAVQEKLSGRSMVRTRKDFKEMFPLRGFACCANCNEPFTASESTSGKGRKHAYYRCRNRQCSESTKSIKKDELENAFLVHLRKSQPNEKVIALVKAVIEDVYQQRRSQIKVILEKCDRDLVNVDKEIDVLVGQLTRTEKVSMVNIYESKIEELTKKKQRMIIDRGKTEQGPVSVGTAFDTVVEYLKNPEYQWLHGDLNDKRRVLKLVFAERFTYDRKSFVGTAKMSVLYELFEQFQGHGYQDVEMARIEPASE